AAVSMAVGVPDGSVTGDAGSFDVDGCGPEQAATSASAASQRLSPLPIVRVMFIPSSESACDSGRRGTDPGRKRASRRASRRRIALLAEDEQRDAGGRRNAPRNEPDDADGSRGVGVRLELGVLLLLRQRTKRSGIAGAKILRLGSFAVRTKNENRSHPE